MAEQVSSILAADFGSVHTRVLLVDIVDGEYRIIAQETGNTTVGYPVNDVSAGLGQIARDIESFTGRTLLDSGEQIITPEDANRRGVDVFIATASAGRPMRAVMVGLMPDISLMTALRAIAGAYIEPVAHLHLRDGLTEEERLNKFLLTRPDMIFVAGGTDGGAKTGLFEILETLKLALNITDASLRPMMLYAGNEHLIPEIREQFEDMMPLFVAKNIRPTMHREAFNSALVQLGRAYDHHREHHGAGFARVGLMSSTGVLPTAQSYTLLAQYFARSTGANAMAVDIGSTSAVMAGAFGGKVSTSIKTDRGVGHSAVILLEQVGEEAIQSWLPFYPDPDEIRNYALNKSLRPASVPITVRDLYLEHAFLRAGLREMLANARSLWVDIDDMGMMPPVKTIIAGGASLTNSGHPALNMMLIADSMQPTGVTDIKIDPYGLVPALGALARINPVSAIQLMESNSLEHLGTLVSIDGQPKAGEIVAKIEFELGDEVSSFELKSGQLLILPVPQDFTLTFKVRLQRGYTIGGAKPRKLELHGGTAGIIFDARGRLLIPPATVEERAEILPRWIEEATESQVVHVIPEEWLIKPEVEAVVDEQPVAAPSSVSLEELAGATADDENIFDMLDDELIEDEPDDEYEEEDDLRSLLS